MSNTTAEHANAGPLVVNRKESLVSDDVRVPEDSLSAVLGAIARTLQAETDVEATLAEPDVAGAGRDRGRTAHRRRFDGAAAGAQLQTGQGRPELDGAGAGADDRRTSGVPHR